MINPKLLFSFLLTINSTVAISTLTITPEAQASYEGSNYSPVSLRVTDLINIEILPDRRDDRIRRDRRDRRDGIFERRNGDSDSENWRNNNDFDSGNDSNLRRREYDFDS